MKKLLPYRKSLLAIAGIISCILIFTRCMHDKEKEKVTIRHFNGEAYAGSEACRNCHKAIYDSFQTTAHHLTSRIASEKYIKGSFSEKDNVFAYDAHRALLLFLVPGYMQDG